MEQETEQVGILHRCKNYVEALRLKVKYSQGVGVTARLIPLEEDEVGVMCEVV